MASPKKKTAAPAKPRKGGSNPADKQRARRQARSLKIEGPAPMTKFDYDFCLAFARCGKQEAAYRELCPDHKDAGVAAMRMMKRPEIREHIKEIYRHISKERQRAAEMSARAMLLSLEMADERLVEVLGSRRRTRGEMLTRDVKTLLVSGATPQLDENGRIEGYELSDELKESLLTEGAPVEDADLLKAIKLTYERKQGIVKAEKKPDVTFVGTMLYRPKWYGTQKTIEATA